MPKRAAPAYRPEIELDANLPRPLYKQLYERLRRAILTGQLQRGERLPSTRTLASELGISRFSIVAAYDLLALEGYVESRVGHGTVVSRHLPERSLTAAGAEDDAAPSHFETVANPAIGPSHVVTRLQALPHIESNAGSRGGPFTSGQPALDKFPYDVWARLIARRARHSLSTHADYQSPAGYDPLRQEIAAHIGITRGVRCTAEQVIMTAGTQGALDLIGRTLLDPGDTVWIENPGFFGARGAFRGVGAHLAPIPVDSQGLDVEAGWRRAPEARLAFVTPSHQYPTGVTMSLGRRLTLLDWASRANAWIVEDDYDSEYRYRGRPLDALQGLDRQGRVLYVGTFSKVLFPALRIGYVVAPPPLVPALLAARRFTDVHMPVLEQMALADFMRDGHYARHLRRMLRHYGKLRACLHRELKANLGDVLEVSLPEAGLELVAWLPVGVDDVRMSEMAAEVGIKAVPLSRQSLEPLPRGGLLLGFAGTTVEGIRSGVQDLAAVLRQRT